MNFQPTSITVTELYNLINQIGASSNSALLDGNFLIIFDCRTYNQWEESHILMANTVPRDENNVMCKPVKPLAKFEHIVVYDEGNVLDNDEASANNFAKLFTYHDARNPVRILDGGFIQFSKKYSFLRSAEMAHTPRQLARMITVSVYSECWYSLADFKSQCQWRLTVNCLSRARDMPPR